jgi:glycosyltransferase involved in cell wall biosynthesis
MTYYCGVLAKHEARKRGEETPLVAHVHATEIDRGCGHGNPDIMAIERDGLQAADQVVAVSNYTKQIVHDHYGVPLDKIAVAHNGITTAHQPRRFAPSPLKKHFKTVLFMGRMTGMKGPEYFLKLAKEVTDQDKAVRFIMVGSGDMEKKCIEQAAGMGLTGKIFFSSFLRGTDVDRAYQMADLFIMPSVSEPFGLVALESLQNGTPAIVSKQSGVSEVLDHALKVDFWDVNEMANKIVAVLKHPPLASTLRQHGSFEVRRMSWTDAARGCLEVYDRAIGAMSNGHAR